MNFKRISIIILVLIGFGLSIELCRIYYNANFNPYALDSFCTINNLIDCDGVAKTNFAQFAGIPLCLWGVFLYSFSLLLLAAQSLSKFKLLKFLEVFKNPMSYIFCLSLLAFTISMALACISIFAIKKICVLCFATYFVDLAIALIAKNYKEAWYFEIKQSFADFKSAISVKAYLIAFITVVMAFVGVLIYTANSYVLIPQLKPIDLSHSKDIKYEMKDNMMGKATAKIIINEYMDYNCASCYVTNLSLRRAMNELDNVAVIQHNIPLDSECNPLVKQGGHEGSCRLARYALAAKKQGRYWEANEILFEKTPKSEAEIISIMKEIKGLNVSRLKEDANSDEIKDELQKEIDEALAQGIDATPTVIINMEKTVGNIPYFDLKEKLIKQGASEKE